MVVVVVVVVVVVAEEENTGMCRCPDRTKLNETERTLAPIWCAYDVFATVSGIPAAIFSCMSATSRAIRW